MTSINHPTDSVKKFSSINGFELVVVGDKKTPDKWCWQDVTFLSAEDQLALDYQILKKLPWDHYCRKMIGYLHCISNGAEVIVDTDDDNCPEPNWSVAEFEGEYQLTPKNKGFVNTYRYFTDQHIWPRGFPLKSIREASSILVEDELEVRKANVGIWQGLVNGEPDVDAIYRLVNNERCFFNKEKPIVLDHGTVCPFNSQNTYFSKSVFSLLYLPAFVTFRFTDILRGLIAQPILWAHGMNLGFITANVYQNRNPHDYLKDFKDEIPCYLFPEQIIDAVDKVVRANNGMTDNLMNAYISLNSMRIVDKEEVALLELWLRDLEGFAASTS
jgi:hypothetical protein